MLPNTPTLTRNPDPNPDPHPDPSPDSEPNPHPHQVLHPRAKHDSTVLEQEGWHYELEDLKEPLTYKGVVFNEMKGVYSSPDSLLYRAAQQATFPDNTYAVD